MADEEHNPDTNDVEFQDEPLIDDDKPMSSSFRVVLILLAVGIFVGGIVWNYHRGGVLRERMQNREEAKNLLGPRYVAPPPADAYPWVKHYDPANSIAARIPPPRGAVRVPVQPDSFAHWLRYLPVKAGEHKVLLHTGQPKRNQRAHWAVLDIDTGPRDLQQCADAILRLRAEYLYARNNFDAIRFAFTSGDLCDWNRWRAGDRPVVTGNNVTWKAKAAAPSDDYANFRRYLDMVFAYAGTISLARELAPVANGNDMRIGDIFIHPGSPGHAVIIVDMVEDRTSGERGFLLAQSFLPAQDMHILVNAYDPQSPPWYRTDFGQALQTPEWTFRATELRRFK